MNRWKVESLDYAKFVDGRPYVHIGLPEDFKKWLAWVPSGEGHEMFLTHAEAIAHAQNEARLTCTNCGRRMPYLEACIDSRPYCHPEQGRDCYQEVRWPGIYVQDFIDASKMLAVRPVDQFTFTKRAKDKP